MKNVIFAFLFLAFATSLFTGCKKENDQKTKNSESVKKLKDILLEVQEKGEKGAGFEEVSEIDFSHFRNDRKTSLPENFRVFKKGELYLFENVQPKSLRTMDDDNEAHSSFGYVVNSDQCICSGGLMSCLWREDFIADDCYTWGSVGMINVGVPKKTIVNGTDWTYHGATWFSFNNNTIIAMELPNSKGQWLNDCYITDVPENWIMPVN